MDRLERFYKIDHLLKARDTVTEHQQDNVEKQNGYA